ncbi:MAG: gamma-glutamyltransferase [Chitinophagaceae bacterium]
MNKIYIYIPACILFIGESFSQQKAASSKINPFSYTVQKKVNCNNGAVVSAHPLASKTGVLILKQGGNAIDAVIATQLALAVVYPGAGNIGGGGFMVAHLKDGTNVSLDFRETAPGKAGRDMYLDSAGQALPNRSQDGHLSAGVPGTVAGLFASLRYARLPFAKLIQPAIELAEKGFSITAAEATALTNYQNEFDRYNSVKPVFIKEGGWKAGDTLVQEDLSNTLKRIRDKGQKGFYEGETARLIVEEMKRGKGIISYADLASYKARKREPVVFQYKGYTILTMPLPASGGVLLPMMMKMVEKHPLKTYGFHSVKAVHLMAEVERLAYADRAKYLGDPDFYKVPVKLLTSDAYIDERLKLYDPSKAGDSVTIQSGNPGRESEETTHISVYDKEGNAAAVTTTLNGGYGSKTVVGNAGFLLNNEMDDFSIKPGVPNMYGAVGGEANAIVPGKRMLSSMTPTIVLKEGKPVIVAGTPGGTTITTSVFQTLINMLEFDMTPEDAVNKPKFHHQWLPDVLYVENDFPEDIIGQLKLLGHKVSKRGDIGRTEVIKISRGKMEAVGDKRGDDSAEGYE